MSFKVLIIKYNRRALCAGDDVNNGVYKIEMPDNATLGDLIEILLHGGNGNDCPIPLNHDGWDIYSNIGKVADVSPDKKHIEYCDEDGRSLLSALGIEWVFGEYKGDTPDAKTLEWRFKD